MPDSVTSIFLTRSGNGSLRSADESAKLPDEDRGTSRLRTTWDDAVDQDRHRVAFFGAFNSDGTILRVGKRQAEFLAGDISLAFDTSAKGVESFDLDNIAGFDGKHRLCIRAIYVVISALKLFRQ